MSEDINGMVIDKNYWVVKPHHPTTICPKYHYSYESPIWVRNLREWPQIYLVINTCNKFAHLLLWKNMPGDRWKTPSNLFLMIRDNFKTNGH
jgi:hypothetical protein